MGYKVTMYPKYPTWGTDGVQKLGLPKMGNICHMFTGHGEAVECDGADVAGLAGSADATL